MRHQRKATLHCAARAMIAQALRKHLREPAGRRPRAGTTIAASADMATSVHPLDADPQRAYGVFRQVVAFCALRPRRIGTLLVEAFNEWSADNASRLGAALAYYTLFSIAPILVVTVGIVGLVYGPAAAHGQISPWLERLFGPEGA